MPSKNICKLCEKPIKKKEEKRDKQTKDFWHKNCHGQIKKVKAETTITMDPGSFYGNGEPEKPKDKDKITFIVEKHDIVNTPFMVRLSYNREMFAVGFGMKFKGQPYSVTKAIRVQGKKKAFALFDELKKIMIDRYYMTDKVCQKVLKEAYKGAGLGDGFKFSNSPRRPYKKTDKWIKKRIKGVVKCQK